MNSAEFLRKIKKVADARGLVLRIEAGRGKGGHQTLFLGERFTVVQRHGKSKELSTGAVAGMLRQLGLSMNDI